MEILLFVNILSKLNIAKKIFKHISDVSHLWCEHFYRLLSSCCDTEKGGEKGKGRWIDNTNEVNSFIAWGYQDSHGLRGQRSAYWGPPSPPHTPPPPP
jgi:hypothetical protein